MMKAQRGIVVPQALLILTIVFLLSITFMAVVQNQIKDTGFEQATISAGYIAEVGFQHIRSDLAKAGGDWKAIPGIVNDCDAVTNPTTYQRCQHVPDEEDFSKYRKVRENPLDPNSKVIGIYEAVIETGELRNVWTGSNQTSTGSAEGFVALQSDDKGYDKYGNLLCENDISGNGCPGNLVGVEIRAWTTAGDGTILPKSRKQSVYGVVAIASSPGEDGPSAYLIDSTEPLVIKSSGQFYGPIHTNDQFTFYWDSLDDETLNRSPTANTADMGNFSHQNVLQVDRRGFTADVYTPGVDYNFTPHGVWWYLDWAPAGLEPALLSTYQAVRLPGSITENVIRGIVPGAPPYNQPNGEDWMPNGGPAGLSSVTQGATTYVQGTHFNYISHNFVDWSPAGDEPGSNDDYEIRYISHQPTQIFGEMSYAGSAPALKYRHEHVANGAPWPLYQMGHPHTNILGANLALNTVSDYDGVKLEHEHNISSDLINITNTNYLTFANASYKPQSTTAHQVPLLKPITPDPGFANYYNQLEQLNKYLLLTLGVSMPRNETTGFLDPATLPTTSDYSKGYMLGDAGQSPPNVTVLDLRAIYFGRQLEYSAGAQSGNRVISDPEFPDPASPPSYPPYDLGATPSDSDAYAPKIWVNENEQSADYMKVSATKLNADYHQFTYWPIPSSNVILMRDGVVKIGNYKPKPPIGSCQFVSAECKDDDNFNEHIGESTIIDGELAVISFTTSPPGTYDAYNKGDIVVAGNIKYRNYIVYDSSDQTAIRQMDPQPTGSFTETIPPRSPAISSMSDSDAMWVTNVDGTLNRDSVTGEPIGKRNGLALYAANEIKIPTEHYAQQELATESPIHADLVKINGQLIAGHTVRVYSTGGSVDPSVYDRMSYFGAIYTLKQLNTGGYFTKNRTFHFDKSLDTTPLVGALYFPSPPGDYENQVIFNRLASLVPGSWQKVSN